ncbi:MAG: HAMP domain-containing histidine kinase [Myxococcales bacterium]|nr:HAMP domain-containing histidine kinase [Myxococcales bacterium]
MAWLFRIEGDVDPALREALGAAVAPPGAEHDPAAPVLLAGPDAEARVAACTGPAIAVAGLDRWPALLAAGCQHLFPAEVPPATLAPLILRTVQTLADQQTELAIQRAIAAWCGVGVVVADAEGRVRLYNDQARAVLGINFEGFDDPNGQSTRSYPVFLGDAHPLHHAATLGTEVPETLFELARGGTVRVVVVPISTGGRHIGALAIFRPANASADQTMATGVHALKNPLSVVQGFVQMLREELGEELASTTRHLLDRIELNTARVWWRVDDLHRYIRLAEVRFEREACPLGAVIAEALANVARRLGREVRVEVPASLPTLTGDFTRLVDLFEALLHNACLYHAPGEEPRVQVSAVVEESVVRVQVEDDGIGVSPDERIRIFEPFHRLHRYDEVEGTGLGLAIARRIAERHSGHIEVHPAEPRGSIFTVTLPIGPREGPPT